MTSAPIDPVELTQQLVRCPSVTPADAGALDVLQALLAKAGFRTQIIERGGIRNLFARWGDANSGPCIGFNGHTDVVPVGNEADWRYPPFSAEVVDGVLYGRGSADMKSGVAAFTAAAVDMVTQNPPAGSIVITITGDEEGDAVDGTTAILDWMEAAGERMDHCLVGEPTCPETMGQAIKIGRRGSMTAYIRATGIQGHSAYPHRAKNPVEAMVSLLALLKADPLDIGSKHFDASTIAVTGFDTGNAANNVIPASCRAMVNIRFNDLHSSTTLRTAFEDAAGEISGETGVRFEIEYQISGESFLTPPGMFSDLVSDAVQSETGIQPELSTSGGTSDARFVKAHCPVVEFGLVGKTMHQVDECVEIEHIRQLKAIYSKILGNYFG